MFSWLKSISVIKCILYIAIQVTFLKHKYDIVIPQSLLMDSQNFLILIHTQVLLNIHEVYLYLCLKLLTKKEKKMQNPKFKSNVLFCEYNWGLKSRTHHLRKWRLLWRGKDREPGYIGTFPTKIRNNKTSKYHSKLN